MTGFADWGPGVAETDVDRELVVLLRAWLPTYLSRVEVERGVEPRTLARPQAENYANVLEDDEFGDHRLPAVLVTTAAPEDTPVTDGDGNVYASWTARVTVVVRGETPAQARELAAWFGLSVRRLLAQQPMVNLEGALKWMGGSIGPVSDSTGQDRYLAAGINTFTVMVDNVMNSRMGPAQPDLPTPYPDPDPTDPDTPYQPLARVAGVTVEVVGRPPIEGA